MAEDAKHKTYTGRCLCGDVTFKAVGLSDIWYCHCQQCQHLTGHCIAAASVSNENLFCQGDVAWSPVTALTNTGHCAKCNSFLFWDGTDRPTISVLAGSIDDTTGLDVKGHIFVSEKKQYFDITDGLPQYATVPNEGLR